MISAQSNAGETLMIFVPNAVVVSTASLCLAPAAGIASGLANHRSRFNDRLPVQVAKRPFSAAHSRPNFNQLSRENDEFQEGSQALEQSIATKPSDFKVRIAGVPEKAETESKHLADARL